MDFFNFYFGFWLVRQEPIFYEKRFLTSPKTHQLFSRFLPACSQTGAWIQIHDEHLGKWQNEKNLLRSVERTDLLFIALKNSSVVKLALLAPLTRPWRVGGWIVAASGEASALGLNSQEGGGHPKAPAKREGAKYHMRILAARIRVQLC